MSINMTDLNLAKGHDFMDAQPPKHNGKSMKIIGRDPSNIETMPLFRLCNVRIMWVLQPFDHPAIPKPIGRGLVRIQTR